MERIEPGKCSTTRGNMRVCNRNFLVALIALFIHGSSGFLCAEGPVLCEFDVAAKGDLLIVPITFAGKRTQFVLNTASPAFIVDKSTFKEALGKPVGHSVVGNSVTGKDSLFRWYRCPAYSVGGLNGAGTARVLCTSLKDVCPFTGYDFTGVLGLDFLHDKVLQIDFQKGKLRFLREVPENAGSASPMHRVRRQHFGMIVQIPETGPQLVVIATGHQGSSITLQYDVFDRLWKAGQITRVQGSTSLTVSDRRAEGRRGFLKRISIGKSVVRDVTVSEGAGSGIGLGLLARFLVTIDFPNRKIYLRPNKRIDEPDTVDCSGLTFWKKDGALAVEDVHENSPASEQGIRPKDTLVRANGKDANTYSLFEIKKLLSREGKQVRLTLRRGEQTFDVTLRLRDYGTYLDPPEPQKKSTKPAFRPIPLP